MKNSLILYHDYAEKFKSLSDEQFGKLIRCMIAYDASGEISALDDALVEMAFNVVRLDLERNGMKYEEIIEKRREAGRKGGIAKASKSQHMLANAKFAKQNLANVADNVNDNVNVNVNVNDNVKDISKDIHTDKDIKEKVYSSNIPKRKVYYPNDEKLNEVFLDFIDMRKKIKRPMSDHAIELAQKKLKELSNGDNEMAIKILDQSIFHSWQGLFELKDEKGRVVDSHEAFINKWKDA